MILTEKDRNNLIHSLLLMGEALTQCGAEIFRVEDTLNRIGYAYGVKEMNVFVITSGMVITMDYADGSAITETRRMRGITGNDFEELESINELSREICLNPVPVAEFAERMDAILRRKAQAKGFKAARGVIAGSALAAGAFALFFGGDVADGIAAAIFSLLIVWMQMKVAPVCMTREVFEFICSFAVILLIGVTCRLVPGLAQDKIMIGDIMLLVPGVAFTNSIRDILLGDTLSGILRFIEAMLLTGALAAGAIAAMWLVAGIVG